jgi:hypothetical protein
VLDVGRVILSHGEGKLGDGDVTCLGWTTLD